MNENVHDARRILLLPGWQDSGPAHWQSRWQTSYKDQRVEQRDWLWPRRAEWVARLDEVLAQSLSRVTLVAHSLGCHLVAEWAAVSAHTQRVQAALLVAPPDIERADFPPQLGDWRTINRQRLPFVSVLVLSSDDPYCQLARGHHFALAWGSEVVSVGPAGHLNGDSGLGDWPQGRQLLEQLLARSTPPQAPELR